MNTLKEMKEIRELMELHHIYFRSGNDAHLNVFDREWFIESLSGNQTFMIESAFPWGNELERVPVFGLKVFSNTKQKIITIGHYADRKDAFNVMSWLRVNKIIINSYKDVDVQKESLESIFAKPVF